MNAFDNRLYKGNILQNEFLKCLKEANVEYILSGYENLTGSQFAKGLIKKNKDKTSAFTRYYPDVVLIYKNQSYLVDVKNSSGIEKDCYDYYMGLSKMDVNILLFTKTKKLCRVKDLVFYPMKPFDKRAGFNVPVIDGVWKAPRKLPVSDYVAFLDAYEHRTSGCTFALIDFNNTPFFNIDDIDSEEER